MCQHEECRHSDGEVPFKWITASYIWVVIKDNHSNEYIWALINLNPLSRKALDCLFGWHIKFTKLINTGCLGKITEFTLTLNIENDRINILRWENSYFDHFWNEETVNYIVAIWRSCHHKFFLVFPCFSLFILENLKHLFQVWWSLYTFIISQTLMYKFVGHHYFSIVTYTFFYIGNFNSLLPSVVEFMHFQNFLNPDVQVCRTSLIQYSDILIFLFHISL